MNPFDLAGPQFLQLYAVVLGAGVAAAFAVRWLMSGPGDMPPMNFDAELSPYEIAYLTGGDRRAIDAAIVRLVQQEALSVDIDAGKLSRRTAAPPANAEALERGVFNAVGAESGTLIDNVRQKVGGVAKVGNRLEELGLILSARRRSVIQLASSCVMLWAALFGLIKIGVGASRGRPVGFLVLMVILSVVAAGLFFVWRPFRTRRGGWALSQLKHENAALEFASSRRARELTDVDMIVAMGLFGTTVLAGGPLASMETALRGPKPAAHAASASSCGVSSCGGGGGGCGGGGCGGGGCGGCGS